MKGWCKIIETETHDVLVRRLSNDNGEEIIVTIQTSICEVSQTLGFNEDCEKADRVFKEKIDENYCVEFINAIEKEFEIT